VKRAAARNHRFGPAFALRRSHEHGGAIMRTVLSALAVVSLLGAATPAFADAGSTGSIHRAIEAARAAGVVGVNEIQFYDGKWEIEGRDPRGRTVNVDVDAITGAVLKIDRD
jgi:acid phosphatase class B